MKIKKSVVCGETTDFITLWNKFAVGRNVKAHHLFLFLLINKKSTIFSK